jgi:hypothetical protein
VHLPSGENSSTAASSTSTNAGAVGVQQAKLDRSQRLTCQHGGQQRRNPIAIVRVDQPENGQCSLVEVAGLVSRQPMESGVAELLVRRAQIEIEARARGSETIGSAHE